MLLVRRSRIDHLPSFDWLNRADTFLTPLDGSVLDRRILTGLCHQFHLTRFITVNGLYIRIVNTLIIYVKVESFLNSMLLVRGFKYTLILSYV